MVDIVKRMSKVKSIPLLPPSPEEAESIEKTLGEIRLLHHLVNETITELFIRLGIATTEPIEMQKDFIYLRALREASQAMKKKTFLTITGVVVTTFLAFVIMQVKSYFQ